MLSKRFAFISILVLLIVIIFTACELLQSGLSSEMQKKLDEKTGIITLSSNVWYYPGAADMDMSLSPKSELALNISKKAAVALPDDPLLPNGLTGAFKFMYNNAAGRQSVAELPFKGGHFNEDFTVFYLDTSPLAPVLNPLLNPTGKGLLELTISGFVNNEDGEQKGRPLQPFTATIDVEPLFPTREIYFSSSGPNKNRFIEVHLNAPVVFTPQADFIITGGTNYPSDLLNADFELSLSGSGKTIRLMPKKELYDREFNFSVNLLGFIPPSSSLSTECSFNINITNSLVVLDGVKEDIWNSPAAGYASDPIGDAYSSIYPQPGNEITGLYVLSDVNNLYVAFEFASLSNMWEQDRIGIMIDKVGAENGDTTESVERVSSIPKFASRMTIVNGTSFVYFAHLPSAAAGRGNSLLRVGQNTIANDTTGNPSRVRVSKYNWVNPNGPLFIEYRFNLNDLGLAVGDQIRVLGVLSNHWDSDFSIHTSDIVPGGTLANSRDAVYDFNNGLSYTLGVGPDYNEPDPGDFIKPSAPTFISVAERGSNGARFTWRPVFNADFYRLYRSATQSGVYTDLGIEWPVASGNDWVTGGTYWYTVAAVNKGGEGPRTAPVQVTMSGTDISRYPTIDMAGGQMDDAFRDPRDSSFTTDTQVAGTDSGGNYTIRGMYLTNDADNLYIALDFGASPPAGYKKSRLVVIVDNPNAAGSENIDSNGRPAVTTVVNTAAGNGFNQVITKQMDNMNDGFVSSPAGAESNASGQWFEYSGDWQCYPPGSTPEPVEGDAWKNIPTTVIKFKIPRVNLGAENAGDTVRVFAAFSEGWDEWPRPHPSYVRGFIPKAAAPDAVDFGDTLIINMANALLHEFF